MFQIFEFFQNSGEKFTKVKTLLEEENVMVELGESQPRCPELGSCLHKENCLGPKHGSSDGSALDLRPKGPGFESRWILQDRFKDKAALLALSRDNK